LKILIKESRKILFFLLNLLYKCYKKCYNFFNQHGILLVFVFFFFFYNDTTLKLNYFNIKVNTQPCFVFFSGFY